MNIRSRFFVASCFFSLGIVSNVWSMNNNRALSEAVCRGDVQTVKELVSQGANALLVRDYNLKSGKKLLQYSLVHLAVEYNHVAIVTYLLSCGIAVNAVDGNGNTPLHLAVIKGDLPMICMLLAQEKIDLFKENNQGMTVYHCAVARSKHFETLGNMLMGEHYDKIAQFLHDLALQMAFLEDAAFDYQE